MGMGILRICGCFRKTSATSTARGCGSSSTTRWSSTSRCLISSRGGSYNLKTLEEDAKRHDITILNPDVDASGATSTIRDRESFVIGLV